MELQLSNEEAAAVHHTLYLRLRELSMTEDHNPDAHRREQARRDAAPVLRAADRLLALIEASTHEAWSSTLTQGQAHPRSETGRD